MHTEEELMRFAEKAQALQEETERLSGKPRPKRAGNIYRVSPPVKRVKGFDDNAQRAEHKKRKRAKAHMRRNPSHASHQSPRSASTAGG